MRKANYGLDAPQVVLRFVLIGGGMLSGAGVLLLMRSHPGWAVWFVGPLIGAGASFLLTGLIMIWGSKVGKLQLRERLLSSLDWRGDERVLDVGCGHGLMLIGAAKRIPRGKAIGVDLWQKEDQAGNSKEATARNVASEGLSERVELQDGDARALPFESGSFDKVFSSWALHNIYEAQGRREALREIARVLKPGGTALIVDIRHAQEYAGTFAELSLEKVELSGRNFSFVIPSRWVTARKPKVAQPVKAA